jgi:transmembrane sensor
VDDLILAFLQDRITAAESARLAAWRSAAPENERHFAVMQQLWHRSQREDPLATQAEPPSIGQLLTSARANRSTERGQATQATRRLTPAQGTALPARDGWRRFRWIGGAVAGVAATLLVAVLATRQGVAPATRSLGSAEFVTDTSETATARLDDGSVVRLAPRSRLRVSHAADARESWLDGEAYFAVAHDKSRPFRVRTRAGTVEVLGTRFDLRVEADELRLIVTEGRVALRTATGRRELTMGEVASVNAQGEIVVETVEDPAALMTWTKGFLVFQETPLRQVARELEARFGVRVLLPDSAMAERTVTAWFTQQNLEQTLSAICRAVDAHCTLDGGVASIEP